MTVFIRLVDVPVDEKAGALARAVHGQERIYDIGWNKFSSVPGSPFAYWVSSRMRDKFAALPRFSQLVEDAVNGTGTLNDFRFVRLWIEGWSVGQRAFAKGGLTRSFYADIETVIRWSNDGAELKAAVIETYGGGSWSRSVRNVEYYGRPGITWPLRASRFSPVFLPSDCVFSVRSYAAFPDKELLAATVGLCASSSFDAYFKTLLGRFNHPEFVCGSLLNVPVPILDKEHANRFGSLATRAWTLARALDGSVETSHAFVLPPGLYERISGIERSDVERELDEIQKRVDDIAFDLYGMSATDQAAIESSGLGASGAEDEAEPETEEADDDADDTIAGAIPDASHLISWLVGVAFGRFDPRLATGERAIPPEPEPFDPLPSRSPGMYPEGEEPADRPDILVDDEGHADDLAARAVAIAERVKINAPENLRTWLAKEFFSLHIKMYSKSRRKAPIYWQLATPSASYSVWLYIHAFSKDTLFRVQNDYAAPKLAHEERRLESLTSELRDGATTAQRKTLTAQEAVVDELRAFLDEVKRVAPLWKPNLDDGVIINFAPLWRLVPQNKSWQKELKSTWDALCEGKYDWAHLAMHLWPERVVPKCAKDRSLAIAHGLEDVFWVEGTDGKWTARKSPTKSVDELVKERTSPAVKSALKSLLEAPMASGKSAGRKGGGRRKAAATVDGENA